MSTSTSITSIKSNRIEAVPERAVALGIGSLTWDKHERVSDRYGFVYFIRDGDNSLSHEGRSLPLDVLGTARGKRGCLIARIEEVRESTHIGDLGRGIFPRTPKKGEVIVLGDGLLEYDTNALGGVAVGLKPVDGRTDDWLDPRSLYDCHEQTVTLFFDQRQRGGTK